MKSSPAPWTTIDLEAYHDGELDAEWQDGLNRALMRDSGLRNQLQSIQRTDTLIRECLTTPRSAGQRMHYGSRLQRISRVAAALILGVGIVYVIRSIPLTQQKTEIVTMECPEVNNDIPARRILFSVPLVTGKQSTALHGDASKIGEAGFEGPLAYTRGTDRESRIHRNRVPRGSIARKSFDAFLVSLDRAIRDGQLHHIGQLVRGASLYEQAAGYTYLRDHLRSAGDAAVVLDQLTSEEQVVACAHWAQRTSLRPLIFERIRRIHANPEFAEKVRFVVQILRNDERLRAWLRSYDLEAVRPTADAQSS